MTQYNPPGQFPPNYGQPVPGYGQVPQSRTSVAAVVSLVCGIIGCFVITPIIAIITGIVGLRATRQPGVGGRGLAVTGLVLGVLWLGGIGCFGGIMGWGYYKSGPARETARQFVLDVSNGNESGALSKSAMTPTDLMALAASLQADGAIADTYVPFGFNVQAEPGKTSSVVSVVVQHSSGKAVAYTFELQEQPDKSWKVVKFQKGQ